MRYRSEFVTLNTSCSAWNESTCSIRTLSQLWLYDNHLLVAEVSEAFHWLSYSSWRLPLGDEHYTGFVPLKFLQKMNFKMSSTKFIHTLYCCLRQISYLFINMLHMLGLGISAMKVWFRTMQEGLAVCTVWKQYTLCRNVMGYHGRGNIKGALLVRRNET